MARGNAGSRIIADGLKGLQLPRLGGDPEHSPAEQTRVRSQRLAGFKVEHWTAGLFQEI
jgi:hypothetical protein